MIFEELIQETMERLNLSSDEARSRIGREINSRYRRATSSIGMETSRRTTVTKTATIGNRTMTFSGIEKIIAVIDKSGGSGHDVVLSQVTFDEMHNLPLKKQPPRHYAVTNTHAQTVDIYMDCTPTTAFTLYADGHISLTTLAGGTAPDFPESFHDILIFGAMADEYRKMEKLQFARDCEADYERRLSDLRMWIAKSAYTTLYAGKNKDTTRSNWWQGQYPW